MTRSLPCQDWASHGPTGQVMSLTGSWGSALPQLRAKGLLERVRPPFPIVSSRGEEANLPQPLSIWMRGHHWTKWMLSLRKALDCGTRSHWFRMKVSVLSVSNTQKPQALPGVLFPVFPFPFMLFWYQGAFSFSFFLNWLFYVFLFLLIKILTELSLWTNLYDECFRSVMRKYG